MDIPICRKGKKKNRKKNCLFLFPNTSSIDEEKKKKTNTLPKNRGLKNNNNNNNNTIYVISIDKARRLASKQIKETVIKAARAQNTVNKLLHTQKKKKRFLLVHKERKNRNRNPPPKKKERNEKKKKKGAQYVRGKAETNKQTKQQKRKMRTIYCQAEKLRHSQRSVRTEHLIRQSLAKLKSALFRKKKTGKKRSAQ